MKTEMLVRAKMTPPTSRKVIFRKIVHKHIKSLPRRSMKLRVDEAVKLLSVAFYPLRPRDVGVEGWQHRGSVPRSKP